MHRKTECLVLVDGYDIGSVAGTKPVSTNDQLNRKRSEKLPPESEIQAFAKQAIPDRLIRL
jgi:hypothetical protein